MKGLVTCIVFRTKPSRNFVILFFRQIFNGSDYNSEIAVPRELWINLHLSHLDNIQLVTNRPIDFTGKEENRWDTQLPGYGGQ
ncbi:hypothetical protein SUGI_0356310 [Cryptomeria japonica]|nr:hypothetical protein SUGI_0356310 [Cryptomeria japonica]